MDASAATEVVSLLTQAPLVRIDRTTDVLEPWLAERWAASPDGLTYTLFLRKDVTFSDGVAFTAADVLFSLLVAYDPDVKSTMAADLQVGGQPLVASALDPYTVVIRFPGPFAPGLRLLDHLPILPEHTLRAALTNHRFHEVWSASMSLDTMAGLGPFILTEHVSGQRLVFRRNPHYFRRDRQNARLPYLDALTLLIIPDQDGEALRLQAGEIDLMANAELRPQDYAAFARLQAHGRVQLAEVGVALDPDLLWFNLGPMGAPSHGRTLLARKAFRQAISYGIDRRALVNGVYLGAAVAMFGPVSPGNTTWYSSAAVPALYDIVKARACLAALGLSDRDGDGIIEDAQGIAARFSILTQAGHIRSRTVVALQEQLRRLGIAVDLVTLDPGSIFTRYTSGDYDSIYFGVQTSSTDPALNPEFWLSSGAFHFWHPRQVTPATVWERHIDDLMHQQAQMPHLPDRQRAFAEVQRILGEELPAIYFVAPRVFVATSARVLNAHPVLQAPQLLWSADTLASSDAPRPH